MDKNLKVSHLFCPPSSDLRLRSEAPAGEWEVGKFWKKLGWP